VRVYILTALLMTLPILWDKIPWILGSCFWHFKNRLYQSTRCQTPEDWNL